MDVQVFSREQFLTERWDYRPGEHVTLIGYTQSGKTTLGFQLLHVTATPDLPAIVMVMKPKDSTPSKWAKIMGIKRVRTWPPPSATRWSPTRPRGWMLWPKLGRIREDDHNLHKQFEAAIADSYAQSTRKTKRSTNRILFADEAAGLTAELGLKDELNAVWMRGSSMGLGLWAATQRPFHVPLHAYNAATHLFLHRDPDVRNLQRYREIGGVDPVLVFNVCRQLDTHQFLYIRRRDYTLCVVDR